VPEGPHNIASMISSQLDPRLVRLLKTATSLADRRGWKAYLVGGAVRDLLLGKSTFDLDILVEEHGLKFAREYARLGKGTFKIYRRFYTALVIFPGGLKVDVTTTRSEEYPRPGALPEVVPASLEEDLLRRDFTINALAVSLNRSSFGRLIDRCGGRRDLEEGIIRVLHPRSFRDDPTRIFRAVRFQQRFGFSIEAGTEELIRSAVSIKMFEAVSPERLRRELELIMKEPHPARAFAAMARYDELRFIHPDLVFSPAQLQSVERLEKDCRWFKKQFGGNGLSAWRMYFGALIWPLGAEELEKTGKKFNLSQKVLKQLVRAKRDEKILSGSLSSPGDLPPSRIFSALEKLDPEIILILMSRFASSRARTRTKDYLVKLRREKLEISGQDLKKTGLLPGPRYRKVLRRVLLARLDGEVRSRRDELALARRLIDKTRND